MNVAGISQAERELRAMARDRESQSSSSREESGRTTRVPLGVARPKLSLPIRPGYIRRWVNDTEGRIANAQEGGYQFVTDQNTQIGGPDIDNLNRDLGTRISRSVDKSTGQRAYAMEIKKEFYDEDQAAKAAKIAETDRLIRHGKQDGAESFYVPDKGRGISIETR